ncbi:MULTISPECIES: PepSY domain-containing protein [unclassified Achromobacter]|uniref:PepSY domain-containing protein n=1 Tax=unclassified Achromobacter TaxID=2626865 RepID=UPI00069D1A45|nr:MULTISPECIES: PepSY domain-containing protein [unclassified Achromobacter]
MKLIRTLVSGAVLGAAALAAHAQTQAPAPAPAPAARTAPASILSISQIHDAITAAGYRDVTEIELEHGRYEAKARDAQAQRVKLYVNAHTGAIERTKFDD